VTARFLRSLRAGAFLVAAPVAATGQQARLTITGGPVAFAVPTVTDFDNGFIQAPSAVTYTVQSVGGGNKNTNHTTTVSIRATGSTLNGTVPIGTLEWRRSDLSTWNPVTTSNVTIESRPFRRATLNDPWSNSMVFRLALSYTTDTPGTYSASLVITLTATTP
jgi:hypothetical protein